MGSKKQTAPSDIAKLTANLRQREAEHAQHRDEAIARVSQTYNLSVSHLRASPDYQEVDRWCKRVRRQVYKQLRSEFPDLRSTPERMNALKRLVKSVFDAQHLFMPPTSWNVNATRYDVIQENYFRNFYTSSTDLRMITRTLEILATLTSEVLTVRIQRHGIGCVAFFSLRT